MTFGTNLVKKIRCIRERIGQKVLVPSKIKATSLCHTWTTPHRAAVNLASARMPADSGYASRSSAKKMMFPKTVIQSGREGLSQIRKTGKNRKADLMRSAKYFRIYGAERGT